MKNPRFLGLSFQYGWHRNICHQKNDNAKKMIVDMGINSFILMHKGLESYEGFIQDFTENS